MDRGTQSRTSLSMPVPRGFAYTRGFHGYKYRELQMQGISWVGMDGGEKRTKFGHEAFALGPFPVSVHSRELPKVRERSQSSLRMHGWRAYPQRRVFHASNVKRGGSSKLQNTLDPRQRPWMWPRVSGIRSDGDWQGEMII